ncbi:flavin reductase [Mesorhizobium sp. L-8-10]|nr:flavin reductase [Mesorhizobium sp. L-8-10]
MGTQTGHAMEFDFTVLEPESRYRLLTNFVGPRPIALVTTRSANGRGNAAPMSFFNVFSHEPPIVVLGIQPRLSGEDKDTVINIRRSGEFVVNMVDMALSQQMLICGLAFESDVDELEMARLPTARCSRIDADYVASSPCSFECRVERLIEYPRRVLVLGEVVHMHVRRECLDEAGRYVNPDTYQPIARLHADNYITSDRQFVLKAPAIADVIEASERME